MKKRYLALIMALPVMAALLCGCGKSVNGAADYSPASGAMAPMEPAVDMAWDEAGWAMADAAYSVADAPVPAPSETGPDKSKTTQKIIYTAWLDMESMDFDEAVKALAALTGECGGYYEDSSVRESGTRRYASYTIRVPADRYRDFMDKVGGLCHITGSREQAEDVSEYYYDTAGRLETQKTKLSRLQELLLQAESMEDIITLEYAISDTEEAIDRLSGELRHYDALVEYSTVNVELEEVKELTEEPPETFATRIGAAFSTGWHGFTKGLEGVLTVLIVLLPWLILAGIIVAVVLLATRKKRAARKAERAARKAAWAASPAPGYSTPQTRTEEEQT